MATFGKIGLLLEKIGLLFNPSSGHAGSRRPSDKTILLIIIYLCYLERFHMEKVPGCEPMVSETVRNNFTILAAVVIKWSACSPSTQTIRVRIPLKSTELLFEKNENK